MKGTTKLFSHSNNRTISTRAFSSFKVSFPLLSLSSSSSFPLTFCSNSTATEKKSSPDFISIMCFMALSDAVLGNLATIYVAIIIAIKIYGLISGKTFSAGFVVVISITAVGVLLAVTLAWDVSRRAAEAVSRYNRVSVEEKDVIQNRRENGNCKGGICWHGVAVRSPASQVRFRLPQHIPYGAF